MESVHGDQICRDHDRFLWTGKTMLLHTLAKPDPGEEPLLKKLTARLFSMTVRFFMIQPFSRIIPGFLLALSIFSSLYATFSHWAINAEFFGRHDMGMALFFSVTFPIAVYASCLIAVVSLLLAAYFIKSGERSVTVLLAAAIVALLTPAYLFFLDI